MRKLLCLATLLLATASASAAELVETIDRTFDVRPGATVSLHNVNGRVSVSSWDQSKVRVIARKEVRGDDEIVREMLKELRVDIQATNGGVTVKTHHPRKSDGWASLFDWMSGNDAKAQVRYDVTVPRNMNVDVTNTNGAIVLSGVNGKHELDTTNGKIEVARCSGSLDAATTNGAIQAELQQITKGQPIRFATTNGRIEVSVPRNLAADLDASTTNGRIRTDLPVTTTSSSKNSLRGAINGGGTPLMMRTTNGGIELKSLN